mgnify:CR=1 FL=1
MKPLPLIIYTDMNSTILDFLIKKGYITHTDRDEYLTYKYITAITCSDPYYEAFATEYELDDEDSQITGWNNPPLEDHIGEEDYLPSQAFIRTFIQSSQLFTKV